jgi:hypothetical protein
MTISTKKISQVNGQMTFESKFARVLAETRLDQKEIYLTMVDHGSELFDWTDDEYKKRPVSRSALCQLKKGTRENMTLDTYRKIVRTVNFLIKSKNKYDIEDIMPNLR